jgi:hypothetical protein
VISDKSEPERLPPPPFWRTRYFAFDVLPRRPELDGRIRLYGYAVSLGCYLRVVLLSDGETVHNAFPDEDFEP